MKKKLIVILSMAALCVCMLTIAVSATKIGDFEYNLDSSTMEAEFGNNQSYTESVVYIPSTVEYDGKTYTVTSLGKNALYGNNNVVTLYIPSTVTKLTENTFSRCGSLTSVYIDTEKLTYIGKCGMSYNDSDRDSVLGSNVISYYPTSEYGKEKPQRITDMKLENLTTLGAGALQGLNVDSLVLGGKLQTISKQLLRGSKFISLTIKGEITSIGEWLAPGCPNLTTVVIESRSLETLGASLFSGVTSISSMTIDLSKVKSVGGSAFRFSGTREKDAPSATQWFNPDGERIVDLSSMEIIGKETFAGSNIGSAKILWPTGVKVENFGHASDTSTFRHAGITGTIYLDAAEGYELFVDTWCFRNNYFDTVIFGPNVTKVAAAFSGVKTLKTVVFLADNVEVTSSDLFKDCSGVNFYFKSLTTNTLFSQANEIVITSGSYDNYGVCGFVANLVAADGSVTIGEAAHTTADSINNALCPIGKVNETKCKFCSYIKYTVDGNEVAPKEHDYVLIGSITYASFYEMGYKTNKCECGAEKANETATENAIFAYRGISVSQFPDKNGNYSITQGYFVDEIAYTNYINAGKTLSYGIVASAKSVTGTCPLTIVDGAVKAVNEAKTIFVPQYTITYNYIDVKVTSIPVSLNGNELVMCLFAFDGEEIYYMNEGAQAKEATAVVINVGA